MRARLGSGRWAAALSFALFAQTIAAQMQEPAWQVPVYAQLPSATDMGGQAVSVTASGARRLVIGAAWTDVHTWGDYDYARFLAIDAATGERVWQRDLEGPCATQLYGEQFVATFANGDVAIANVNAQTVGGQVVRASCYARLDADGRVLWRHVDMPDPASPPGIRVRAIAVDRDGDVVATGYSGAGLRTLKLSGSDGQLRWAREEALPAQTSGGSARVVGDAAGMVLAVRHASASGLSIQQILALDATDGHVLWRRDACGPAATDSYVADLRALGDGSLAFAEACRVGTTKRTVFGRLAGDGRVLWQREVEQDGGSVQIDAGGTTFAIGGLSIGGQPSALARFAADDGRLEWAVPGSISGPEPLPGDVAVGLSTALGNGSVYVWELIGKRVSIGVYRTRLSRYDAQTGRLQDRREIAEPSRDYLSWSAHIHVLPDGEVLLAGLGLYGGWSGRWLWLARVHPANGVVWSRREAVSAARRFSVDESGEAAPMVVAATAGTPGLVMAGVGITTDYGHYADRYPYLAKLAQDDGRVLWRWQPDPVVPGDYAALYEVAVDAAGQVIVVGSSPDTHADPQWSLAPLLAKVDAASGRTLWLRHEDAAEVSDGRRSVALDVAGNPFVLSPQRLRRHAAADGRVLWEAPIPDADTIAERTRVVVDAAGQAIVAAAYDAGAAGRGVQVAKFRGNDGVRLWLRRLPATTPYPAVGSLELLPGGDVALTAGLAAGGDVALVRVAGNTGGVAWQRSSLQAWRLLVDREGQLVLGGSNWPASTWQLSRLNAANGATLWQKSFPGFGDRGEISRLIQAPAGELLIAGQRDVEQAGFARIAMATGETRWTASIAAIGHPAGIVRAGDGGLFVAANAVPTTSTSGTATLFRFAGPLVDRVFGDGFD